MMTLDRKIEADLTRALREKEAGKVRLGVLRMVKARAKLRQVELGRELEEAEWTQAVQKELKERRDARPDYARSGRAELLERLDAEIRVLEEYLPKALTDQELAALVDATVKKLGASTAKDMGRVMGAVMGEVKGRAPGDAVRLLVEAALAKG